eukprot:TRINITY_DN10102_c0_g1_i2.p2 TRINITY_DN10102_c0_g1~~TRINITY_DN10102_c0_g1_i2.p2  ORF type:complete len:139 (+),score=4.98 TRINITY_DN10102_c0_g1_i2:547-963(+)
MGGDKHEPLSLSAFARFTILRSLEFSASNSSRLFFFFLFASWLISLSIGGSSMPDVPSPSTSASNASRTVRRRAKRSSAFPLWDNSNDDSQPLTWLPERAPSSSSDIVRKVPCEALRVLDVSSLSDISLYNGCDVYSS